MEGWLSRASPSPTCLLRRATSTASATLCSTSSAPCSSTTLSKPTPVSGAVVAARHLRIRQKYPNGRTRPASPTSRTGSILFSETGHSRRREVPRLLEPTWWACPAGLPHLRRVHRDRPYGRQTLPGAVLRACRVRVPPRKPGTQYDVLLSLLGKFRYTAKYPADNP